MRSALRNSEGKSGINVFDLDSADVYDRLLLMYGESRVFEYHKVIAERGRSSGYRITTRIDAGSAVREHKRDTERGLVVIVSHRIAFRHFPRKYGSFVAVSLLRVVNNYFDFARRNFVNDFGRIHHAHVVIRILSDYAIDIVFADSRSVAALAGERYADIVRRLAPSEPALFGLDSAQFELKLPGIAVFDRNGRNGYPHGALGHRVVRGKSALVSNGIVIVGAAQSYHAFVNADSGIFHTYYSARAPAEIAGKRDAEARLRERHIFFRAYEREALFEFKLIFVVGIRQDESFAVYGHECVLIQNYGQRS